MNCSDTGFIAEAFDGGGRFARFHGEIGQKRCIPSRLQVFEEPDQRPIGGNDLVAADFAVIAENFGEMRVFEILSYDREFVVAKAHHKSHPFEV